MNCRTSVLEHDHPLEGISSYCNGRAHHVSSLTTSRLNAAPGRSSYTIRVVMCLCQFPAPPCRLRVNGNAPITWFSWILIKNHSGHRIKRCDISPTSATCDKGREKIANCNYNGVQTGRASHGTSERVRAEHFQGACLLLPKINAR
ncbi:jg16037 [Pararge aegeria aegeria]|uniref:Jg16037 protein n=1 Tax=Pararge aegeria aegeria TaxID=348720 RepID=A0A8S4SP27_9NEOP|nr:jg16037 [Pararge aegeria aegeria]